MSRLYVKPAPGRTVPDPERGGYLPEAGDFVPRNAYWLRRLTDKDVTEAKAPAKAKTGGEA